jgi:hypothetical protein
VTLNLSTLALTPDQKNKYRNVTKYTDLYQILKARNVSIHFKIAKIICNKVGWKLEFDTHQDTKCKLHVPLFEDSEVNAPEIDEEEYKEGFDDIPTNNLIPTAFISRPGSGLSTMNKSHRDQVRMNDRNL